MRGKSYEERVNSLLTSTQLAELQSAPLVVLTATLAVPSSGSKPSTLIRIAHALSCAIEQTPCPTPLANNAGLLGPFSYSSPSSLGATARARSVTLGSSIRSTYWKNRSDWLAPDSDWLAPYPAEASHRDLAVEDAPGRGPKREAIYDVALISKLCIDAQEQRLQLEMRVEIERRKLKQHPGRLRIERLARLSLPDERAD